MGRQVEAGTPWGTGLPSTLPGPAGQTPSSVAMTMRAPGPPQPTAAPPPGHPAHHPGLAPAGPGLPAGQFMMNPQLMSHNQAFLASATNLMMGMGLPGAPAQGRPGEARFDAYKGVPGTQLPRY